MNAEQNPDLDARIQIGLDIDALKVVSEADVLGVLWDDARKEVCANYAAAREQVSKIAHSYGTLTDGGWQSFHQIAAGCVTRSTWLVGNTSDNLLHVIASNYVESGMGKRLKYSEYIVGLTLDMFGMADHDPLEIRARAIWTPKNLAGAGYVELLADNTIRFKQGATCVRPQLSEPVMPLEQWDNLPATMNGLRQVSELLTAACIDQNFVPGAVGNFDTNRYILQ